MIHSQRQLAVILSKLRGFSQPSWEKEQYATPSNIAAEWVWAMAMKGELAGKTILDAACGPGILGLGALLLGAKKVYFIDLDQTIVGVAAANYEHLCQEYPLGKAEWITQDAGLFDEQVDIVVQNPPFGTKQAHLDKRFLEKAFSLAPLVYSMHKWSTKIFVEAISRDHGFLITDVWRFEFPIKAAFVFHKKPVKVIDVGLWRMERMRKIGLNSL